MKQFLLGVVLVLSTFLHLSAKEPVQDSVLQWTASRKLSPQLYNVVSNSNARLGKNGIVTRSGFTYTIKHIDADSIKSRNEIIIATVLKAEGCFISTALSKQSPEKLEQIMRHEERHFDISEIHARELVRFFNTTPLYTHSVAQQTHKFVMKLYSDLSAMQKKYDEETDYGRNASMQEHWDVFITAKLNELLPYSRKEFYLHVLFK